MKIKLSKDLSVLTTIPEKALEKLAAKALYCVSGAVAEAAMADEESAEIDLDLGRLLISFAGGELRYKFVPDGKMDAAVKNAVICKQNLLETALDESLVRSVTSTYKDLL